MVAAGVGGIDGESVVVTVAEFPYSSVIWTVTIGRLAPMTRKTNGTTIIQR